MKKSVIQFVIDNNSSFAKPINPVIKKFSILHNLYEIFFYSFQILIINVVIISSFDRVIFNII